MNEIKKESKYIFNKESPGHKIPMLLIYPIYFLAGMGINLVLIWLINIVAWFNDYTYNFNWIFRDWSSLIWLLILAVIWSGFILLWHEHITPIKTNE